MPLLAARPKQVGQQTAKWCASYSVRILLLCQRCFINPESKIVKCMAVMMLKCPHRDVNIFLYYHLKVFHLWPIQLLG